MPKENWSPAHRLISWATGIPEIRIRFSLCRLSHAIGSWGVLRLLLSTPMAATANMWVPTLSYTLSHGQWSVDLWGSRATSPSLSSNLTLNCINSDVVSVFCDVERCQEICSKEIRNFILHSKGNFWQLHSFYLNLQNYPLFTIKLCQSPDPFSAAVESCSAFSSILSYLLLCSVRSKAVICFWEMNFKEEFGMQKAGLNPSCTH